MIVVVGLSHRTASIQVREALAIESERIPSLLQSAVAEPTIGEAMLVSTCNRVEFVTAPRNTTGADLDALARAARSVLTARAPAAADHLYEHVGMAGVRHLFRVAASLDSLVLGEPQILGQVKSAYEIAQSSSTVGPNLHRAVSRAIRSAKRVRSETTIGSGMVSVPSVAVDLTRQIFGEPRGRTAALVGSGEMAETVARLLGAAGARILVVGRNASRVAELAATVGGEPRSMAELDAALREADVVITSTSAPGFIIDYDAVKELRRKRRGRSLFFVDLAVPRDVDPRVESLDGIFLYNIDDLSNVVAETLSARRQEAERAEAIVAEEVAGFDRWAEANQVTPTIVALRTRFREILAAELERSLHGKLKHLGDSERTALERMLDAALNKLLHEPAIRLKRAATEGALDEVPLELMVHMVEDLFALTPGESEATPAEPVSAPSPAERSEALSEPSPATAQIGTPHP